MNRSMLRQLAAACVAFVFAAGLSAQKLTVNPSGILQAGSTVTINYSNPSLADTDVTIQVQGGFPVPSIEKVVIHLDAQGNGSGTWVVNRNWLTAGFNAPGVNEVMTLISRLLLPQ